MFDKLQGTALRAPAALGGRLGDLQQRLKISRRSGIQSPAATFCPTCSAEVAPAITEPTVGIAASPRSRPASIERSRSAANVPIASITSKLALGRADVRLLGQPAAPRSGLAAAVLPGQQPAGEREVRQQALAGVLQRRHQLGLGRRGSARSTRSAPR